MQVVRNDRASDLEERPCGAPSSAATPAIETDGLTKVYGAMLAVDHLNLIVERGEIFGFLGPNGAGKTTTMRMLLGLIRPTSGRARVLDLDVATQLPQLLARTGAIIENPTFYPYLSGEDNLRAAARLSRVPDSNIGPILDLVDLTGASHRRFSTYSLGMKQRLAVGAALLADPELLILDEPANGLDPAGIVEMRGLMKRLKEDGRTVLISSHVLHEIEQICDRIAILNHGRVVVQGKVNDLLGAGAIEIRVDPADEAERVLRATPWIGGVTREGSRLRVTAGMERSADLTRVLADHALYVSELRPEERSLEQYFLDVTGENS
ncbi:MAG: ABC transporter ATP-binding protein [Chloroflexota bacterium]